MSGFVGRMDREGAWELVPIAVARTSPSGPVDQQFFDAFVADVVARLRAAGPLDGVYISEHGAASATVDPDPDGTLFAAVREVVGPAVPVVATLDLHANISQTMVEATDLLVAYRTNPHVDMFERGVEAADAMLEMFGGLRTAKAMVKLPLMPPSLTQRTEDGPYGDAIRAAEQRMARPPSRR
jgi:microcystin degradation protein MlrC